MNLSLPSRLLVYVTNVCFLLLGAGAVIHTHSIRAVMATLLYPGDAFRITHQEMIKGIRKCQSKVNYKYLVFNAFILFLILLNRNCCYINKAFTKNIVSSKAN